MDGSGDPDLLHFYLPFKLSPLFGHKKYLHKDPFPAADG